MCNKRNTVFLHCYYQDRNIHVDNCLALDIISLWKSGFQTVGCCCGHGKYEKTILVKKPNGEVEDVFTSIIVPRKRRFYRKDNEGYYYIPEVEDNVR